MAITRWAAPMLFAASLGSWPGVAVPECPPSARVPGAPAPGVAPTIAIDRVLLIRDVEVVDDPIRTKGPAGAWSFGRLMTELAAPNEAPAFVKGWLRTWQVPQTLSGTITIPARPGISKVVIDAWKERDGHRGQADDAWSPNLENAPFRLLAIVFRPDLAVIRAGRLERSAEGRFVFGVLDIGGEPLDFTVIFEYELAAANTVELQDWARRWAALGTRSFDTSAAYNAALQQVTDRFTRRGALPSRPTASALNQVRTNEIALDPAPPGRTRWELREFNLVPLPQGGTALRSVTVKQTPRLELNGSEYLAGLVNENETLIKDRRFVLPPEALAGSAIVPNNLVWNAPGIRDNQARHLLALGTCNGCHHRETPPKADAEPAEPFGFLHIGNRAIGTAAELSRFLSGGTVVDPVGSEARGFNELEDRKKRLEELLCGDFVRLQSMRAQRAFRVH